MSKFIHQATLESAYQVASQLREDDLREVVEGHGLNPTRDIPLASSTGFCVSFNVPDGRIAGLAGIQDEGRLWMLTTPAIHDFPVHFARESKRFIHCRPEPYLWNIGDHRNTAPTEPLTILGFPLHAE